MFRIGEVLWTSSAVNAYEILSYRNPGAGTRLRAEELEQELLQSA